MRIEQVSFNYMQYCFPLFFGLLLLFCVSKLCITSVIIVQDEGSKFYSFKGPFQVLHYIAI